MYVSRWDLGFGIEARRISLQPYTLLQTRLLLNSATSASRWVLPAIFAASLRLFALAVHADNVLAIRREKPRCLEEAARTLNKAFSVCATDRFNTAPTSRKWGSYYMCNLLFRTYFRVRQINLAGNLIRSLKSVDLPELDQFPIAHAVTYRYYMGVLAFYDEQYKRAQDELTWALQHFPPLTTQTRKHNQALLLAHLIPINLLAGRTPAPALLGGHPRLRALFADLIDALGAGRLGDFDAALAQRQMELIGKGLYLTLERCRIVCFRNLARRVFFIRDKTTRLELRDVLTAVHVAGCTDVDMDEIECMVANLIDKGFVKGYISHERLMLVLSPKDAFPALSSVPF
ncbi:hypothetical protein BC830DRAFT_1063678 [Chytriomyces sp. MP71]|nr:hypothetical protein BC830DRAFT_1063678 [Chytriomyces sp. MP71]